MSANYYFYIQAIQFVLLCFALFAAYATYKNRVVSYLAVYGVALWFFVFKFVRFFTSHTLPLDISAICYCLYSVCLFVPIRPLKVVAAQFSALCGVIYGLVFLSLPQVFCARDPEITTVLWTITNHSLLFFGGLAMMGHVSFKKTDLLWTALSLAAMIAYIEVCVAKGVAEGNAVFSKIIDGTVILIGAPSVPLTWWYYMLYYSVVFILLGLWLALTYAVNRRVIPPKKKVGFFAL